MDMERGFVKTFAGNIHYRAVGAGAPIVLMHINQRSSAFMVGLMEALAPRYRAIAFDHPCFGMSDHVARQLSLGDFARNATEVLDGLGLARATVLGEAFSALVAVELAARHADRVERAVLVNCPYWEDVVSHDEGIARIKASRPGDATGFPALRTLDYVLEHDPEHAPLRPTQEWMDQINLAQVQAGRDRWQIMDAMSGYDVPAAMEAISRPTLLLYGDQFLYTRQLDQVRRRIPGAQHRLIADGRFEVCWEHPDSVAEAVGAFAG